MAIHDGVYIEYFSDVWKMLIYDNNMSLDECLIYCLVVKQVKKDISNLVKI